MDNENSTGEIHDKQPAVERSATTVRATTKLGRGTKPSSNPKGNTIVPSAVVPSECLYRMHGEAALESATTRDIGIKREGPCPVDSSDD